MKTTKSVVIKTKEGQQDVASKIASEVRLALDWNPSIEIEKYQYDDNTGIEISDRGILSSYSLEDLFKIAQNYSKRYPKNIGYYITTTSYWSDRQKVLLHKPVFTINVELEK